MFHLSIIYFAFVVRSFEWDKIALDLVRAFFVEFVVAKLLKKVEEAEEVGA